MTVCAIVSLLALVAVAVAAEPAVAVKPTVVPFELLKSRHMVVSVKINGKGPFRLIFDTGAPMNLINNRLAKEAGVITSKTPKPLFTVFGALGQFPIKELQIGTINLPKVQTMVMDHPTVETISKYFGPIDGIVGFPFFARFRTSIDYEKRELTLTPNDYKPGDLMETMTALMLNPQRLTAQKVFAPAGVWGVEVRKAADDDEAGVTVAKVWPESAAAAAGLKPGDRLLTLDGRWTDSVLDFFQATGSVPAQTTVPVKVSRDGKARLLQVTPKPGL